MLICTEQGPVWSLAQRIYPYKWLLYLPKRDILLIALLGLPLTQGQQAAVGLQHHVPVELPLRVIQVLPFIPGKVHRHILKGHQPLE